MDTETFGEWLKQELASKGISQKEFADLSGVTPAQISRIISGTRGVGEQAIIAIARALHLPVDLVFEKANNLPPKTELSPMKRRLIHLAEGLPDSDIELAAKVLEARIEFYSKNPQARPEK